MVSDLRLKWFAEDLILMAEWVERQHEAAGSNLWRLVFQKSCTAHCNSAEVASRATKFPVELELFRVISGLWKKSVIDKEDLKEALDKVYRGFFL